jgi:hypothetical protein
MELSVGDPSDRSRGLLASAIPMTDEPDDERPGGAPDDARVEPSSDPRVRSAWRSWLSALAADAEAAMAAALAYESLPPEARDAWLDALEADEAMVDVPAVALYAPLLAVEPDDSPRRARIEAAIAAAPKLSAEEPRTPWALRGVGPDGTHACIIVAPLYLRFVQVLSCRYTPAGGFVAVCHDPLRHADDVAKLEELDGIGLEPTPLGVVVEELAHAILADKREHRASPTALASFAHLFGPDLGHEDAWSR